MAALTPEEYDVFAPQLQKLRMWVDEAAEGLISGDDGRLRRALVWIRLIANSPRFQHMRGHEEQPSVSQTGWADSAGAETTGGMEIG